jgi:hypothetical protein
MRARVAAVGVGLMVGVAGCGTSEHDAVLDKVDQFASAAASRDYRTICDQVLAPSLLQDMARGGIHCVEAMQIALGRVHHPRLKVGNISITGATASALTISQAKGQQTVLASIRLVQTAGGWRISSLGAPVQ